LTALICSAVDGNKAPSVRVEPQSAVVDVGNPVEFHCYATGHPSPRIEWTRGRGRAMPEDVIVEDGVLRFDAASVQHEGEYFCTAINIIGSDRQTATVRVRPG